MSVIDKNQNANVLPAGVDDVQVTRMIERRHPYYARLLSHWEFLEATYEGGREWFTQHLHRFYKEGDEEYKGRLQRAYRFNHTREVVDLVNKYIFKSVISRKEDAPEYVTDFWKQASLQRRPIDDLMRLVSEKSSIYGKCWVVVDSSADDSITTKADLKAGDVGVYAWIAKPQDVLDMSFDRQGNLLWIMIREWWRDDEMWNGTGQVLPRYRLWTRDQWMVFEPKPIKKGTSQKPSYTLTKSGNHDLGVVPVIPSDHIITEQLFWGPGLVDDVGYMDRAVANYLSNLDTIIQDQTFSQLVIPAQSIMPGDEAEDKVLQMGTKRIFTYDAQGGSPPSYISPDPKQAQMILSVINKIISEIYHTVGMAGERTKEDNAMGIDNSSGVAKAYDFERMNAMLASKAKSLQYTENRIVALVRLYNGDGDPQTVFQDDKSALVQYPTNFDVRSLYDEFEIAQRLALIPAPDAVRQEQMKTLIAKLNPGASDATLKQLNDSVEDNWPPLPVPQGIGEPPLTSATKQGQNQGVKDAL